MTCSELILYGHATLAGSVPRVASNGHDCMYLLWAFHLPGPHLYQILTDAAKKLSWTVELES
jgi:hypothetical protein